MKSINRYSLIFIFVALLTACSPHPTSGVWKATEDNELGITRLVASFDGRAEFTTSKLENAVWHCFWSISDKTALSLNCTPSTNPDHKRIFSLSINDQNLAELRDGNGQAKILATFIRLDENPSLKKP